MSDLGTDIALAFSRALCTADFRCLAFRSLRAVTASTSFHDSTGRVPGSAFHTASAFTARWRWNINQLPVGVVKLWYTLGPANPRLICSAEEPLLFRPSRFSPDYRCYCDQDCRYWTVHTSSRPGFRPTSTPTYAVALSRARPGLGGRFEPRSFWAPQTSAGKLLRFS